MQAILRKSPYVIVLAFCFAIWAANFGGDKIFKIAAILLMASFIFGFTGMCFAKCKRCGGYKFRNFWTKALSLSPSDRIELLLTDRCLECEKLGLH